MSRERFPILVNDNSPHAVTQARAPESFLTPVPPSLSQRTQPRHSGVPAPTCFPPASWSGGTASLAWTTAVVSSPASHNSCPHGSQSHAWSRGSRPQPRLGPAASPHLTLPALPMLPQVPLPVRQSTQLGLLQSPQERSLSAWNSPG